MARVWLNIWLKAECGKSLARGLAIGGVWLESLAEGRVWLEVWLKAECGKRVWLKVWLKAKCG